MAFTDPVALILLPFAILGLVLTLTVGFLMIWHREKAVVKYSSIQLNALLLLCLFGSFSSSVAYIGRPVDGICKTRESISTVCLGFALTCTMSMAVRVIISDLGKP